MQHLLRILRLQAGEERIEFGISTLERPSDTSRVTIWHEKLDLNGVQNVGFAIIAFYWYNLGFCGNRHACKILSVPYVNSYR